MIKIGAETLVLRQTPRLGLITEASANSSKYRGLTLSKEYLAMKKLISTNRVQFFERQNVKNYTESRYE
jgi:hypothetical protein